jgi:hypothetical protein
MNDKSKIATWWKRYKNTKAKFVKVKKEDLVKLTAEWVTDKYYIITTIEYKNGKVSSIERKAEPLDKNLWWHMLHEKGPWEE